MQDESATVGQRQVVADQIEVVGIDGALLLEEGSPCRRSASHLGKGKKEQSPSYVRLGA